MRRCCLLLALLLATPARAEHPLRVTTDSPEYCLMLVRRLAAQPASAQPTIRHLVADGLRLCEDGHIRTGIAKLRRALRLVHHPV
jgi:hypothetical protein